MENKPNYNSISTLLDKAFESMALTPPGITLNSLKRFNSLFGGFRLREFSILCGATGVGKTTLLANWSVDLLKQNVPHFVASVETGPIDYLARIISALLKEDLNTGDPVSVEKLSSAFHCMQDMIRDDNMFLSLYDYRVSNETLMSDIKYMVDNHGCKVVFLDNLNFFMEITSSQNQIIEMDKVIHDLIIFCKQVDVHIVMVMHPKKTDNGRVDSEFDIKGSSTAVQEAHNVFLFNRLPKNLLDSGEFTNFHRELKIQKCRRKGKSIGSKIILRTINSVAYEEEAILSCH